jgi:hypothetical protein|uniref:Uncharacterized protein n=1 Tax=viral metagenome TaxID=1070528 RepID=A0A6C0IW84_9ZZZZ
MESILLGTLGYFGDKLNDDTINKIEPNNKEKCKLKHVSHKKNEKKVYSNNISNKINKATINQAKKVKESGFAAQFDTIMLDNTGPPVSANQSNTIRRDGNNGYNVTLQRDIDFKNEYSEFGKTQMHYDVVPQIEMMTSNMQPHSSKRDLTHYNMNNSHVLGLHTGVDAFYKSKDTFDPVKLFEPMKDLTFVNGAPVMTDLLEERYIPSYINNNGDLPFQNNMKVQPGLNGKVHQPNEVIRVLPKTTEEIRSKTNQKISYKAAKIEAGKKGEKRSASHNLTHYKLPTHRERDMDDYLPNKSQVNKKAITGKFSEINTNRSQSANVIGHAHDPTKGVVKNGKVTESAKAVYASDSISRSVSNVHNKPVLQNKKSFRNAENERTTSTHNIHGNAKSTNKGSYTIDTKDVPLTTLRQLMIDGDTNMGITNNNTNSTYVFSKDCVMPNNNRVTTVYNMNNGNLAPTTTQSYVLDNNDKTKSTIRQTTEHLSRVGTINPDQREGHYLNENDIARDTIRQTTEHMARVGTTNPDYREGHYFNDNDIAKSTIKQTTEHLNILGAMNPSIKEGHYFNKDDIARSTIKQTTEYTKFDSNVNSQVKKNQLYSKSDKAKQTIRQTTENNNIETAIQPVAGGPNYVNYKDTPGINIRNTTSHSSYVSNTNRAQGNNPYLHNMNNKARPTIKSNTLYHVPEKNMAMTSVGNVLHHTDKAKTTIRQSTLHSTQGGRAGNETGTVGYARDLDDMAKKTIKQTTLHSTQAGRAGTDTVGYARDLTDKAKPTIKSSTLHSTQGGRVGRSEGGELYVRDEKDIAKATIKQTTLHSTQGGRAGKTSGNSQYVRDKTDKARVTIKQTTLLKDYTGPLNAEVEKNRSQQAEQNMTIDERKEILTYNRPAGPKSDLAGPVLSKKNVRLKEENYNDRINYGYDKSNANSGHLNQSYTRNKEILNNPTYRINDDFINTLNDNPLVNDLRHQSNQIN